MRLMRPCIGLLAVLTVLAAGWRAAPTHGQTACTRGALSFSSWRIPGTDGRSGWRPLGVDGNRVVMVRGPGDLVARPGPLTMALLTAGSARYQSIPAGAYPHAGILQRWQFSWPWIVGVFNLRSSPTLGWTLWAGNVQTGQHIVLDQGHAVSTTRAVHAVPDFDLANGTAVWTSIVYTLRGEAAPRNRIALYNLAAHHASFLPIPASPRRFASPSLWGTHIVWERYTGVPCTNRRCPNSLIDLQLYDLATRNLRTLTRSSVRTGNSFSPGLWRSDLVFQHGRQDAQGGGIVILVDLASHVPGKHRFWWQHFRYRVLQPQATVELNVRDGLASWDGGLADLAGGGSARLPLGEMQWSGGRSLVVQPIPPSGPAPYSLLHSIRQCSR